MDTYQSEDVFEHLPYDSLVAIVDEKHRVLRPGGLFRLSTPDSRFAGYADRSLRGPDGALAFDPGGGGRLLDWRVLGGGHLWFPTVETVEDILRRSRFETAGS